jgi:hypothetical protein
MKNINTEINNQQFNETSFNYEIDVNLNSLPDFSCEYKAFSLLLLKIFRKYYIINRVIENSLELQHVCLNSETLTGNPEILINDIKYKFDTKEKNIKVFYSGIHSDNIYYFIVVTDTKIYLFKGES